MNNNKEDLTNATMQALSGNLENSSNKNSDTKKRLNKLVEDYAKESNYIEIFNIIISIIAAVANEDDILDVLDGIE